MRRLSPKPALTFVRQITVCISICVALIAGYFDLLSFECVYAAEEPAPSYVDRRAGVAFTLPKGWNRIEYPGVKAAFLAKQESGWSDNVVVEYMAANLAGQAIEKTYEAYKAAFPDFQYNNKKEVTIAGQKGIETSAAYFIAPQIKNNVRSAYLEYNGFVIAIHLTYRNMDEPKAQEIFEAIASSIRFYEPSLRVFQIISAEGLKVDELIENGKTSEAGIALTELLAQHPDDPWLLYLQGIVLARQGRPKHAAAAMQKAFDRGWFDTAFLYDDEELKPIANDLFGKRTDDIRDFHQGRVYLLERLKRLLPGFQTLKVTEQGATILTDIEEEQEIDQLRHAATTTARFAKADLGITPTAGVILWVIPKDQEMFRGLVENLSGGTVMSMGMYFPAIGILVADRTTGFGTFTHEYMHALHHVDQMMSRQNHKLWVWEMIASIYEGLNRNGEVVPSNWRTPIVKDAKKNGALLPLGKLFLMSDEQLTSPQHYNLAMAQLRLLGVYLRNGGVLGKFYDRYKTHYNEDKTGEAALTGATGLTLDELDKHWQEWIDELPNE